MHRVEIERNVSSDALVDTSGSRPDYANENKLRDAWKMAENRLVRSEDVGSTVDGILNNDGMTYLMEKPAGCLEDGYGQRDR